MNFYLITSVLVFFGPLLLALFVYFRDQKNPINISYALLNIALGIWGLWDVMSMILRPTDLFGSYLLCRFSYTFAVFVPALYFHFVCEVSRVKKPLIIWGFYLISLILSFLAIFNLHFVQGFYSDMVMGYPRTKVIGGFAFGAFTLFYFATGICGIYQLFSSYAKQIGKIKIQLKYVIFASLVAYSAGPLYFMTAFGASPPPIDNVLIAFYLVVIAYSITKHHLLDITVIIGRTAAYMITILIFGLIYLLLVFGYTNLISAKIDPGFLALTIVFGILVGEFFQRVRFLVQTSAEKAFLKGKYDYRKVLSRMSQKLAGCKTMGDINAVLEGDFMEEMEAKSVRVILIKTSD